MTTKSEPSGESSNLPPHLQDLHCFTETQGVITTTMFDLPGYKVTRVLGTVYGITVRSRNWATSFGMILKSIAGGELRWFTNMLYTCRNESIGRAVQEVQNRGGNALVAMHFDQGELAGGFAQCCAYGTACVVEKVEEGTEYPQLKKND